MSTIAIIDYGMGNLGSVAGALATLGARGLVVQEPAGLVDADRVILPGVGSFAQGMAQLESRGWTVAIQDAVRQGKPLLGICLGMHLLASSGTEGGDVAGLDLIPGKVDRLDAMGCRERVPHVGWNSVRRVGSESTLLADIPDCTDFYFVHSYAVAVTADADRIADVQYGVPVPAVTARGRVYGTQFHPEKSSKAGLRLLQNFLAVPSC